MRERAEAVGSDGCTGVPEWHRDCCLEHDVHYRTGQTLTGVPINRAEADAVFRECLRRRSRLSWYSPLSWWRWAGVRVFGRKASAG